jgi:hypothetical protein
MKQQPILFIFTIFLIFGYSLTAQEASVGEQNQHPTIKVPILIDAETADNQVSKESEIPIEEINKTACEIPQSSKPQRLSEALSTPIQEDCKGKVFNLSGNFIVDDVVEIANPYTRITMSPDSKITVKNNGSLRLSNTLIAACDSIWKGIVVEEGGELTLKNSFIEQSLLPYPPIETQQIGTIAFSPNPASAETVLKLSLNTTNQNKIEPTDNKCTMTDESGIRHTMSLKSGASNNEYTVNLTHLKSGFYQVIVSNPLDQNLFVGKVLVAHN